MGFSESDARNTNSTWDDRAYIIMSRSEVKSVAKLNALRDEGELLSQGVGSSALGGSWRVVAFAGQHLEVMIAGFDVNLAELSVF